MPPSLTVHWPYLLVALAMLWFPRQWLRLGPALWKRRRRSQTDVERFSNSSPPGDPENKTISLARELRNKRNYLDFLRAALGGWALLQYSFEAHGKGLSGRLLTAQAAVLLGATLIQCLRFETRWGFFAPIFFFAGLSIALSGPIPALFALVFMFAINPAIPNPRLFISLYALLLIPLGYFLDASRSLLILNVLLLWLPPVLSLLGRRSMAIYAKKPKLV
ncbi:MAG: hypothetical protein HY302_06330 [Opitutae bacterium]|nr:hypothetical protein [Opitutae bacterium]